MSEPNLAAQLSSLLENQHRFSSELKDLLQQEQQFLLENQTEPMAALIEQKEKLARQMAIAQNQLNQLAEQYNRAEPEHRLAKLIQAVDPTGHLSQQWESLLELAKACKALNETNGATINLKKRYAESGLAILRGQTEPRASNTYSKRGIESGKNNSSGRILNKA